MRRRPESYPRYTKKNARYHIVVQDIQGNEESAAGRSCACVAFLPNTMTWLERFSLYMTRFWEFFWEDPREGEYRRRRIPRHFRHRHDGHHHEHCCRPFLAWSPPCISESMPNRVPLGPRRPDCGQQPRRGALDCFLASLAWGFLSMRLGGTLDPALLPGFPPNPDVWHRRDSVGFVDLSLADRPGGYCRNRRIVVRHPARVAGGLTGAWRDQVGGPSEKSSFRARCRES